jgi:hypothetical protein
MAGSGGEQSGSFWLRLIERGRSISSDGGRNCVRKSVRPAQESSLIPYFDAGFVRSARLRSAMPAFAIAWSTQALALPADPVRVTYIPEISEAIGRACATPAQGGWVMGATIIASRPAAMEIACSLGRVEPGPTAECERNCGYENLRTIKVRLTNRTMAALRASGCADISICTKGFINRPGDPSRVAVQPSGALAPLRRDVPPLLVEYGSDVRGYWVIDAGGNRPARVWNATLVPINLGTTGQNGAMLVSRISMILPDLRRDLPVPMVCNGVWVVSDLHLQQLGAFKGGRPLRDVVRSLTASREPRRVC